MPVSAATELAEADSARESHALAFRIAFAAAVGLTLGEVLGWDFPFLPAMLAVQLLSGRGPISVKQGVALCRCHDGRLRLRRFDRPSFCQ